MTRHSSARINLIFALLSLITAIFPVSLRAQNARPIRSPKEFLGFVPGEDRTIADWKQITSYFNHLDKASDRIRVKLLGASTLGKPLIAAFISSPENLRNMDKIQANQKLIADPRKIDSESGPEEIIASGKVVVAISCSIHSTEIVASQMSMQLAYELATADDENTVEILENTVLILIPSPNPDGIDIVANWYRRTLGTRYEGSDPPELYHYYAGHDDNRDWFMLNLRETRLINRLFWKEWFPEIVYDIHQQGISSSRMFVPPFFDPANPRIAPVLLRQVGLLGSKIASDLQREQFQGVITNALYDTWWHGGFRTAPYFHNSVGILTEAASAKVMTPATVTREQLARASTRGMPNALEPATNFPDPWQGGTWHPGDILKMEMIACRSVLSMAAKFRSEYLTEFLRLAQANLKGSEANTAPESYLIPPGQGHDENIATMIDILIAQGIEVQRLDHELHITTARDGTFTEAPAGSYIVFVNQPTRANVLSLFEKQVYPDRRTASGEAERPYDVTGWTLPMQMGIETQPIYKFRENKEEMALTMIQIPGTVWRDFGLKSPDVSQSRRPSPISLPNPIRSPRRIGIYQGKTGNMDEGWTRFVFDTFNVKYTSLHDAEIRNPDLRKNFEVIILPSMRSREIVDGAAVGSYPEQYTGGIGAEGVRVLKSFVEEGGTLICFDASTDLAIKGFDLPVKNVLQGVKSSEFYCPGSILRVLFKDASPLTAGMGSSADVYFINSSAFEVLDNTRVNVVATYADQDLLRSGWLLGAKILKGKAALVDAKLGTGHVVLFAFRPQHRAQTWGTFPLIWNAIESSGRGNVSIPAPGLRETKVAATMN